MYTPMNNKIKNELSGNVIMSMANLMSLLQLGDSLLPVGAFSFSNGLESAVQNGLVKDKYDLWNYVISVTDQAASSDGIALLHGHRAALKGDMGLVISADKAVYNRKLNEELRTMTVRMGKKLAELACSVWNTKMMAAWLEQIKAGKTMGTYPVTLGLVFAELDHPEEEAFAVHQYGLAMMILGASLRLMKVDHLDTQSILAEVNAKVDEKYQAVVNASLNDMAVFAPVYDIQTAFHIKSKLRLFMN